MLVKFEDVWRKVVKIFDDGLIEAKSYIDGSWQDGAGFNPFYTYEPAIGERYGLLWDCSLGQIQRACSAAESAQQVWHFNIGIHQKKDIYTRFMEYLAEFQPQIALLRVKESGRSLRMCDADVQELIDTFSCYRDKLSKEGSGELERCEMVDKLGLAPHLPYGRGLNIYPWNFLAIWGWGVAADLTGGNASIVKVSEETPFGASVLTELFHQSMREVLGEDRWQDVRALVQQLHGKGEATGADLVKKGQYEHISFTGGIDTARLVGRIAGHRLKPMTMELGGHGAMVLMGDFPIDRAVEEAKNANLGDAGQRCVSTRVVFVEEPAFQRFIECYIRAAKAMRIGHPLKIETELTPLISERQLNAVEGFVARAKSAGLKPVIGGYALRTEQDLKQAKKAGFNIDSDFQLGGYYYLPTVFVDVPMHAELMVKECFGPVLCINSFSGKDKIDALDNAIKLVNQSDYGLSNALLTHDLTLAMRSVGRVKTGIYYIGRGTTGAELDKQFGGVKNSGFGRKGKDMSSTTYIQQVYIDYHPAARLAQTDELANLKGRYNGVKSPFDD